MPIRLETHSTQTRLSLMGGFIPFFFSRLKNKKHLHLVEFIPVIKFNAQYTEWVFLILYLLALVIIHHKKLLYKCYPYGHCYFKFVSYLFVKCFGFLKISTLQPFLKRFRDGNFSSGESMTFYIMRIPFIMILI